MAANDGEKLTNGTSPVALSRYQGKNGLTIGTWRKRCGFQSGADGLGQPPEDLGEIIFIDLRDRTGMVQVVTDHKRSPESFKWQRKYVQNMLCVSGTVVKRAPGTENPNSPTGTIEVMADRDQGLQQGQDASFRDPG